MATKVKPCRIKATGTPQVGYVPKYVDEDTFQWGAGGGGGGSDIEYVTQAEYNALLPGALTDGKHYFIYSTSGGGGWQPGVNTMAYMPFSGNYDDTQGNTVTQSGTAGTYATTQQGEQYMVTAGGPLSNNTLLTISNLNGLSGDGNWTASCWVNPTNTGNLKVIRGYGMSSSTGGTGLILTGSNEIVIFIYAGDIYTGVTITPEVWNNIVFTHSSGTNKVYVNGSLVDTRSTDFTFYNSRLGILADPNNGSNGMNGGFDEMIIEDKTRTDQEVLDYYNQTKGNYEQQPRQPGANTLAYFPLVNDTLDQTGNLTLVTPGTATQSSIGYTIVGSAYTTSSNNNYYVGVRCKVVDVSGVDYAGIAIAESSSMQYYYKHSQSQFNQKFAVFYDSSFNYGSVSATMSANQWHHIATSYDSVANKTYGYLDGVEYLVYNGVGAYFSNIVGAFGGWSNGSMANPDGNAEAIISDFIIESEGWTAQEVLDYYNQTKGDYGIS